jgi:hypothetical protein
MPPDKRDYRLENYLATHAEISSLSPDTTVQELIDGGYLTTWHGIYAFWRWVKTLLDPPPPPPPATTDVVWKIGPITDQGNTPHCVGFTGLDYGNCEPVNDQWPNEEGHTLYYACKVIDGEEGAEDGSHSRSLCKVLQQMGRIGSYAFTDSVDTIRAYVREHGPIGTGIPWDDSMFRPDQHGYVWPDENEKGGHEVLVFGHYPSGVGGVNQPSFGIANHWGDWWGDNGCCYITERDYQGLLDRSGDAFAALELPL